jgi:adenylate cyclase
MLEKAIALDRNSARAQIRLVFTLQNMGEPETALPHFERALQLSPRDPNQHWFYNGLGTFHLLLGNLDLAVEFLLKARSVNPRIYEFSMWLAAAHGLRGDAAKAKEALAEFRRLKPELTSLAKIRAYRPHWFSTTIPQVVILRDKTWVRGLRLAGLPAE